MVANPCTYGAVPTGDTSGKTSPSLGIVGREPLEIAVSIKGTAMEINMDHQVVDGDTTPNDHHALILEGRDVEGGVEVQHAGRWRTHGGVILHLQMPIKQDGIHMVCEGIPIGGEGDTIAVGTRRASSVEKLPGPGECSRTVGGRRGSSLVTIEHVNGLRRGRGRGTRRARKARSMSLARLERSRHGVHVGLGHGSTDVGEVGGEDRHVREAITKR